jgi:membrane protein YqaA with SNARE-associated domain
MKKLSQLIEFFERFVERWWYSPILGICAGLDHYVIVFPILGMMVSSIFLAPRKWLRFTIWTAIGSWAGAWALGWIARVYGLGFIQAYFPQMLENPMWDRMQDFFSHHGVWLLFLVGLMPIPQQPAVIISAIAGTPLAQMAVVLLIAKLIKFGLLGYVASHAPSKLAKFRGVQEELEELHVKPPL